MPPARLHARSLDPQFLQCSGGNPAPGPEVLPQVRPEALRNSGGHPQANGPARAGDRIASLARGAGAGQWRAGTGCAEHMATNANRGGAVVLNDVHFYGGCPAVQLRPYLNQRNLDGSYVDAFGDTKEIQVVPHAEDALLALRLVIRSMVAGMEGADPGGEPRGSRGQLRAALQRGSPAITAMGEGERQRRSLIAERMAMRIVRVTKIVSAVCVLVSCLGTGATGPR